MDRDADRIPVGWGPVARCSGSASSPVLDRGASMRTSLCRHPADCRRPYEHQLEEQDNAPSILRFGRARTVLSSHDPRVDEARHI